MPKATQGLKKVSECIERVFFNAEGNPGGWGLKKRWVGEKREVSGNKLKENWRCECSKKEGGMESVRKKVEATKSVWEKEGDNQKCQGTSKTRSILDIQVPVELQWIYKGPLKGNSPCWMPE